MHVHFKLEDLGNKFVCSVLGRKQTSLTSDLV